MNYNVVTCIKKDMKTISLISKKIREQYQIKKLKDCLSVNHPGYVHIDFDKRFKVYQDDTTFTIKNSKCVVRLWKRIIYTHVTILKANAKHLIKYWNTHDKLLEALQAMDNLDKLEHMSDEWWEQAEICDKLRNEAIKKATQ